MLMHASPRIGPIIVHLTTEHVPADAPHVLVLPELGQVVMAHRDIVDILNLEGQMVETGLFMVEAEEHVMVYIGITAITPIERADQIALLAGIDVVRADKSQSVAEPGYSLAKFRGHQDAVADALHMRRPLGQTHQLTRPQ